MAFTFRHFILLAIFYILPGASVAQQPERGHSGPTPVSRLLEAGKMVRQYTSARDCDSAAYAMQLTQGITVADIGIRNCIEHVMKADYYRCTGNNDSVIYHGLAAAGYKGSDPAVKIEGLRAGFYACNRNGDFKKGIEILQQLYKDAFTIRDTAAQLFALNNLSNISTDLEIYDDAVKYRRMAIELSEQSGLQSMKFSSYSGMANLQFTYFRNPDSAIYYYNEGLKWSDPGNAGQLFPIYINLAASLNEKGNYKEARLNLDKAAAFLEEVSTYQQSGYYNTLGYLLFSSKNFRAAIEAYKKSNELLGVQDISVRITNTGFISDAYAELKDYPNAYRFHFELEQLKDSLRALQTDELLIAKDKEFQTSIAEQKNALLQAKNEAGEANLARQRIFTTAVVIILTMTALLLVVVYRNYRRKRKNELLLENLNRQLTSQRDEILKINQLLQLKVLRSQMNPHFIYNCLNSILTLVQLQETGKASHYLYTFSVMLRRILDFSDRQFIDLDEEMEFLNHYLTLEKLRLGEDFLFEISSEFDPDDDVRIPSLIVQPFVENAVWHGLSPKAGKKLIRIVFSPDNDPSRLRCTVSDNGIGRKAAAELKKSNGHTSRGLGITTERLELLRYQSGSGINMEISDGVPDGTKVELLLPCMAHD